MFELVQPNSLVCANAELLACPLLVESADVPPPAAHAVSLAICDQTRPVCFPGEGVYKSSYENRFMGRGYKQQLQGLWIWWNSNMARHGNGKNDWPLAGAASRTLWHQAYGVTFLFFFFFLPPLHYGTEIRSTSTTSVFFRFSFYYYYYSSIMSFRGKQGFCV